MASVTDIVIVLPTYIHESIDGIIENFRTSDKDNLMRPLPENMQGGYKGGDYVYAGGYNYLTYKHMNRLARQIRAFISEEDMKKIVMLIMRDPWYMPYRRFTMLDFLPKECGIAIFDPR